MEITVGAFVILGLACMAALVVKFSSNSTSIYNDYIFSVAFPSADGIIKGSRVLMAGVHIGRVVEEPRINDRGDRAVLDIGLAEGFSIRRESEFVIRESGLLGDRYIDVLPNPEMQTPSIQIGETVEGRRTTGLGELTDDARPVILKADEALNQINSILAKIDASVLTTTTQSDIKGAIARLNSILTKIDDSVLTEDARGDLAGSLKKFNSVMGRLDRILAQAEKGEGILAKVLTDKTMADDLRAFVQNLRQRGILWYKDQPAPKGEKK